MATCKKCGAERSAHRKSGVGLCRKCYDDDRRVHWFCEFCGKKIKDRRTPHRKCDAKTNKAAEIVVESLDNKALTKKQLMDILEQNRIEMSDFYQSKFFNDDLLEKGLVSKIVYASGKKIFYCRKHDDHPGNWVLCSYQDGEGNLFIKDILLRKEYTNSDFPPPPLHWSEWKNKLWWTEPID